MNEPDEPNNWGWGAARELWSAAIIVDGQDAPDHADYTVRQVTWASHDEAVDFLTRHMPGTTIPDRIDYPGRRRIVGEIRAASLVTMLVAGEVVEWVVLADKIDIIAVLQQQEVRLFPGALQEAVAA